MAPEQSPEHPPLPTVTTSDLSRSPGRVLERVARGERLIVCRHNRPIATLQPLDGVVLQPWGPSHDIYGWPIGDALEEAGKLNEAQRELLIDGISLWRFAPARLSSRFDWGELIRGIEDMGLRGLAVKTERGWEPTGRGWVLREALLRSVAPNGLRAPPPGR